MNIEHDSLNKRQIESHDLAQHPLLDAAFAPLLRASIGLSIVALGLCGFVYSSAATGLGQVLFPEQANGSLVMDNDRVLGSRLVAQSFTQAQYFQPRPSAAKYDPMAVSGSNMAITNPDLHQLIDARLEHRSAQEQIEKSKIPADLVTASGSGIDPEISVASAMIQVKRIAQARKIAVQDVEKLIQENTIQPTLGILGQTRVNVLALNLALDGKGE